MRMEKHKKNKKIIQSNDRNTAVFLEPELTYKRCCTFTILRAKETKTCDHLVSSGAHHRNWRNA